MHKHNMEKVYKWIQAWYTALPTGSYAISAAYAEGFDESLV